MLWWDLHFNELYLRMFQTILTAERTAEEVQGVLAMLNIKRGARILDLCCGQGRHAVPLTLAAYRITGLDRSDYLLREAQRAARRAGVEVDWVRGDMRQLPWREQFDACLNLFTAFGYFYNEAENQAVLHEISRVLRPRGKLLLDVSNRDYYLLRLWPRAWRREGRAIILEDSSFNAETCRFTITFTWVEGDKQESLTHSVRHYTAPELKAMLRQAGLMPTTIYGDFDGSDFDLNSKRLIVVAHRT